MNELLSQSLRELVYWKKADLTFEPGITCILGHNKNARVQGASNGSGKSSLFIPLHSALGYAAPLIKGKQGARDAYGRGSEGSVEFKRGKHVYKIVRKGPKYQVLKDGQDLGLRTQQLALETITRLRGLTEAQFYSTVYLDSSKAHAIQSGSSAERLHFFTDLFDLHNVDEVKKYCAKLLSAASDADRECARIQEELKTIDVKNTEALENEYAGLVRKQNRYQTALRTHVTITHKLDLLEADAKAQAAIEKLMLFAGGFKLSQVRADLAAHSSYREASAAYRTWKQQVTDLESEIRGLQHSIGQLSLKEARAKLLLLDQAQGLEKPEAPDAKRQPKAAAKLCRLLGADELQSKHRKTLDKKQGQLQAKTRELQATRDELASHLDADADGKCPMCLSRLKPRHFQTLVTELDSSINKTKKQLSVLKSLQEALSAELEYQAYEEALTEWKRRSVDYTPDAHKQHRKYVQAMQTLKRLRQSEPPTPSARPKLSEDVLLARQEQLLKLRALKERPGLPEDTEHEVRQFCKINGGLPFDIPVLRTYLADQQEKVKRLLTEANNRIPQLRSQIDVLKAEAKRARQLRRQLSEHKANAADLPVLQMLVEAYSKTGIKNLLIKRLARQIEKNLNALAPRVLHEPMSFQLIVEGQNFHVLATRRNLGKTKIGDVRTLSGAERRMFILLFLLATLPMLPSAKRYDTLVLDEPDANLDPPNRMMLRDRLLPRLLKVVPKIVVLTPNQDIIPQGARVLTAVKHNNVSVLQPGYAERKAA